MIIDPYKWHRGVIQKIVRHSPEAVSVVIKSDQQYRFRSGEHAIIRITDSTGAKIMRQYSYSSAPASGTLEFTIIKEPGGAVSGWFNETAQEQDAIEISQPYTGPLAHNFSDKNICMIAGNSGIAPMMSHLRNRRTETSDRATTLLYSTHRRTECFSEELLPISDREFITVKRTDETGRFSDEEILESLKNCDAILICGSRDFALAMRKIAETILPSELVHSEAFTL